MELFAITAVVVYVLSAALLGTRLVLLHREENLLPAALLGWCLLLGGPVVQGLGMARNFLPLGTHDVLREWLLVGVLLGIGASLALITSFNHRVYHPRSLMLSALPAVVATLCALSIAERFFPSISVLPLPLWRVFVLLLLCIWTWSVAEALRHWAAYRRIPELDPLVVDRFRMWGLNGLGVMGWAVTGYFFALSTLSIGISAVFGLIAAAGLWLAFLPPTWYRRRLLGRSLQSA